MVLVSVAVGAGLYDIYKEKADGGYEKVLSGVAEDAAIAASEVVVDSLEDLVEALPSPSELGEIVGAATAAAIQAGSAFSAAAIREAGPALVDGIEGFYDAVRDKLSGREVGVVAAFTVGVLVILTGTFLFYEVRRGPAP